MDTDEDAATGSAFGKTLVVATKLPGVRIDRADYLRRSLARYCTDDQIRRAISETPAIAGVPAPVLAKIAKASIARETGWVTALPELIVVR